MVWRGAVPAIVAAILTAATVEAAPAPTPADKPARIVSTQLCGDQLLLLLADRDRIAALSYFAADANLSALAELAEGLPRVRGAAETVLPLDPDLTIAGAFTARPTVFLLRRLNRRVLELPVAQTFDDIRANIRLVADAIGETERGERLADAFDADLAALPAPPERADAPVAALYWSKGYTPASASLAGAAVRRAGFVDLGKALGFAGAARVSLESLILARPELIVQAERGASALADLPVRHPAIAAAFGQERLLPMPDRLWLCGAPFVLDAVRELIDWREGRRR